MSIPGPRGIRGATGAPEDAAGAIGLRTRAGEGGGAEASEERRRMDAA